MENASQTYVRRVMKWFVVRVRSRNFLAINPHYLNSCLRVSIFCFAFSLLSHCCFAE